jgi:CRISPR/Cas system endoribonuclease Cas6 (RAMP superfamily)
MITRKLSEITPQADEVAAIVRQTVVVKTTGEMHGMTQDEGDVRYRLKGVPIPASEIVGLPNIHVAQFAIGDGVSKDITITHNLGTQQIVDVALRRVSDNSRRYVGWTAPTENTVVLGTFGVAPGESSLVASISYIAPTTP